MSHNSPYAASLRAADAVAEFLSAYRGNTAAAYRRDLSDFLTYCRRADIEPLAARRADLNLYLRALEDGGLSPATVARRLVALRGLYRYLLLDGMIERSPAEHIRYRQPHHGATRQPLDLDELRALLAVADADGPRTAALVWLLATTGIRVSEACTATWDEVAPGDPPHLQILGKGRRRHLVPLVEPTWNRLTVIRPEPPYGPLFATRSGRALDRRAVGRLLNRLAQRASLHTRVSPHAMRHTFVTLARQNGCQLPDIQDAVGHSNPATTRRYDHLPLDAERHPAQRLVAGLAR